VLSNIPKVLDKKLKYFLLQNILIMILDYFSVVFNYKQENSLYIVNVKKF